MPNPVCFCWMKTISWISWIALCSTTTLEQLLLPLFFYINLRFNLVPMRIFWWSHIYKIDDKTNGTHIKFTFSCMFFVRDANVDVHSFLYVFSAAFSYSFLSCVSTAIINLEWNEFAKFKSTGVIEVNTQYMREYEEFYSSMCVCLRRACICILYSMHCTHTNIPAYIIYRTECIERKILQAYCVYMFLSVDYL